MKMLQKKLWKQLLSQRAIGWTEVALQATGCGWRFCMQVMSAKPLFKLGRKQIVAGTARCDG
jgi:hypothetical protein